MRIAYYEKALSSMKQLDRIIQRLAYDKMKEAVARADSELEVILGGCGKRSLMNDVSLRYGLTLSDAVERPGLFQSALHGYLGELGSTMVMSRINKKVWGTIEPSVPTMGAPL